MENKEWENCDNMKYKYHPTGFCSENCPITAEAEEAKSEPWTDRPDYNDNGEPNE